MQTVRWYSRVASTDLVNCFHAYGDQNLQLFPEPFKTLELPT